MDISKELLEQSCAKQREETNKRLEEFKTKYNIYSELGISGVDESTDDIGEEEVDKFIGNIRGMLSELGLPKSDVAKIIGVSEYRLNTIIAKANIAVDKDLLIFNKGTLVDTEEASKQLGINKEIVDIAYARFKTSKSLISFDDLYEKAVIEGYTQANIADALGISRQRIKQVFTYYGIDLAVKLKKEEFIMENKETILKDYHDGMSIKNLSNKYNVSELFLRGLIGDNKRTTIADKIANMEEDIKKMYESGMNLKTIAELLGVKPGTLITYTKKFGIVDTGKRSVCPLPEEEVIEKFKSGISTVELGKMYDVSYAKIYTLLKKHGVYPENISKFNLFDYLAMSVLGYDMEKIAEKLGFTVENLDAGIEFKSEEIMKALKIISLREKGLTHSSVAAETGYPIGTCVAYYTLFKKAKEKFKAEENNETENDDTLKTDEEAAITETEASINEAVTVE